MSLVVRRPAKFVMWLSVVVMAVGVGTVGTAAAAPYCGITWGSLAKAGGTAGDGALDNVRTGRHECFDRVVFDLSGRADGYRVEYVSEVRTDGEGRPLYVAGGDDLARPAPGQRVRPARPFALRPCRR